MSKWITISALVCLMGLSTHSYSQEIDHDAKSPTIHSTSKKEKAALKKKEKHQHDADKAEKKLRKGQVKIQTKAVRKRMKKSRKEADRVNSGDSNRPGFFKRLFSGKKRH